MGFSNTEIIIKNKAGSTSEIGDAGALQICYWGMPNIYEHNSYQIVFNEATSSITINVNGLQVCQYVDPFYQASNSQLIFSQYYGNDNAIVYQASSTTSSSTFWNNYSSNQAAADALSKTGTTYCCELLKQL